jgi:hypothetical protein
MSTVEIKSFNEFLVTFYSVEQLKEGRLFHSEMFLVNQFHPWKLQFGLYNNKEIFCSLIYFGDLVLDVNFKIQILVSDTELRTGLQSSVAFNLYSSNRRCSPKFDFWLRSEDVYTDKNRFKNKNWPENKITFLITFRKLKKHFSRYRSNLSTFRKSNSTFIYNPDFSDMVVLSATEQIPVHKFILNARSEYIRNLFHSEMSDSNTNEINMTEFSDVAVQSMVEFMYSDNCNVENLNTNICEIWEIADKYLLSDLKTICLQHLQI